jgi:hypothetical protein
MANPDNVRAFERVNLPDEPPAQDPALARAANAAAIAALGLALKALSQKAIAAVRDIFTLLSIGSVFWIWQSIPEPTTTQIMSHSIYAVIILMANVIVRRV